MSAVDCKFDGTLAAADFRVAAQELCARWEEESPHLPRWTWIPLSSSSSEVSVPCLSHRNLFNIYVYDYVIDSFYPFLHMEGYLSLETFYSSQQKEENIDEEQDSKLEEAGIDDDDKATLVMEGSQIIHYYEFHIVYSFSYKVPVLYFRGYKRDGGLLNLKLIESDFPLCSSAALRESKWTFITQEEHPVLHRPWYKLHPCGTSDWMKLLLGSGSSRGQNGMDIIVKQYLSSWLSVVGQAVGLKVPLKLYSILHCMPVADITRV